MCGIVGQLWLDGHDGVVHEHQLVAMRDTMIHRGPDDGGVWLGSQRRIGLAHRRLSIIDPTMAAHQPMASSNGRFHLVFNGEIYNHADLRRELVSLGRIHWQTHHSDTEVILQAFEEWGIDAVHRFRGMFAFALWDAVQRELWLVRDRIGVKPLYYTLRRGQFAFASEIKALLKDPEQPRELNDKALYHYLTFLCTPAPMTLFHGIEKLAPGTWMRLRADGRIERCRYWELWDHVKPRVGLSEEDTAAGLIEVLREAVKLRKVSDVPVGVFLSGGIDSSTNAVLFAEGEAKSIQTFSIGYDGSYSSYQNETAYARQLAESVGAIHHERLLSLDDLLNFVPKMVHHQDEPIADPVCVPLYFVSKLARDAGVIVCQVGEGADELFVGYNGWIRQLEVERLLHVFLKGPMQVIGKTVTDWLPWKWGSRFEYLRRAANGQPIFWGGATAFTESEKKELLAPEVLRRLGDVSSFEVVEPVWRRFQDGAWEKSSINWMAYMDLNLRLPELLLMRVDKMSMAASVEARVPFLDHQFVAHTLGIPSEVRFRDGIPKAILKRAVRGLVPEEVVNRKKQGFGIPMSEWFATRLAKEATESIERFAADSGLFSPAGIRKTIARRDTARIWCLYNLATWWNQHFGEQTPNVRTVEAAA